MGLLVKGMLFSLLALRVWAPDHNCTPPSQHILGYPEGSLVGVEVWDKNSGHQLGTIASISPSGVDPRRVVVFRGNEGIGAFEEYDADRLIFGAKRYP